MAAIDGNASPPGRGWYRIGPLRRMRPGNTVLEFG
jgi:hypothetical protein